MNPVNRYAWIAVILLGGVGWNNLSLRGVAQTEPTPSVSTPSGSSPNLQFDIGISKGGSVELLVVGAEKTQLLRLQPKVGQTQTMNLLWKWQTGVKVAGKPVLAMNFPPIVATIETKVVKVESNGDIHYQMNYRDVDVRSTAQTDKNAAALKQQFQSLVGLKGDFIVNPQGQTKSANLTLPQQLSDAQKSILQQFSQSLANLSAPLPEFPVGIGGKWQHQFPLTINGAKIDQQTTYELLSLKDNQATIGVTLNQTAQNQRMASSVKGMGDFQLENLNSQGQGQMVVQLDQIMPISSSFNLDSQMVAKLPNQASKAKSGSTDSASLETESKIQVEMTSR